MEFSDKALILKVGKFKEHDLWVKLLSPQRGLFSAFAFGGSRSIRRFCGCLDVLNHVLVKVHNPSGKPYLNLTEGTLIAGPSRLRTDMTRFGMVVNCFKFLEAFGVSVEGAKETYAFMLALIAVLENEANISTMLPLFFRFRLASIQGFAPQLGSCQICKDEITGPQSCFFHPAEGSIFCEGCKKMQGGSHIRLEPAARKALKSISEKDPPVWAFLNFENNIKEQCARAIDDFISYHVGLSWQGSYFKRV